MEDYRSVITHERQLKQIDCQIEKLQLAATNVEEVSRFWLEWSYQH